MYLIKNRRVWLDMDIQRFGPKMTEDPRGEYVRYSDYIEACKTIKRLNKRPWVEGDAIWQGEHEAFAGIIGYTLDVFNKKDQRIKQLEYALNKSNPHVIAGQDQKGNRKQAMKICCISDIHGNLIDIPECDLLLIAGDICPVHNHSIRYQLDWLEGPFKRWLDNIRAKNIVACWGNHDFVGQESPRRISNDLRWTIGNDEQVDVDGLKIWLSAWQPWYYDWAFNAPRHFGEEFLKGKYDLIPPNTDIILTHSPAKGYADKVIDGAEHPGSQSLTDLIMQRDIMAVVSGHLHSGYGVFKIPGKRTMVYGSSILNDDYIVKNPPHLIEVVRDDPWKIIQT